MLLLLQLFSVVEAGWLSSLIVVDMDIGLTPLMLISVLSWGGRDKRKDCIVWNAICNHRVCSQMLSWTCSTQCGIGRPGAPTVGC